MRHARNPAMVFIICSSKIHLLCLYFRESKNQNTFCLLHSLNCILRESSMPFLLLIEAAIYKTNGRVVVGDVGNSTREAIACAAASQTSRWRRWVGSRRLP